MGTAFAADVLAESRALNEDPSPGTDLVIDR